MRIRKRFLSLSAALTAPLQSDLLAGNPHNRNNNHQPPLLVVQHQELHPNENLRVLYENPQFKFSDLLNHHLGPLLPSSSDHTTQIGIQPSTWVSSGAGSNPNNTKELESERKKEIIKTDDTARKESILCAEANGHDLVLKGWLEGDRLIPIKKRRGITRKRLNHDFQEDNEMIEGTMKSKPKNNKKNEKRGNMIKEGSGCSRVNGRGWRCGQQTRVGYSLCEHHLGKGRIKSMTNVRGRAQMDTLKEQDNKEDEKISMDHHDFEDDVEKIKDWEEEPVSSMVSSMNIRKRKKLGVVKARSLSSLLSQTGN